MSSIPAGGADLTPLTPRPAPPSGARGEGSTVWVGQFKLGAAARAENAKEKNEIFGPGHSPPAAKFMFCEKGGTFSQNMKFSEIGPPKKAPWCDKGPHRREPPPAHVARCRRLPGLYSQFHFTTARNACQGDAEAAPTAGAEGAASRAPEHSAHKRQRALRWAPEGADAN